MTEIQNSASTSANSSFLTRLQAVWQWFSISRLLRWAFYFFVFSWVYLNWHESPHVFSLIEKYAFPDSKFVEIDGMNVHLRISGKGEPLLLLHDVGSSLHTWTHWTDHLSNQFQVISVDLPGFGLTGPHPLGSYSSFMYVSFLGKLVDSLQLKQFNLVGNGMGAQIAWIFTAENPNRVKKLILLNAPGFEKPSFSAVRTLARTPIFNQSILKITPKQFVKLGLEENFANDGAISDSLVQRHFDLMLFPGNRQAYIDRSRVTDNNPPVEFIEKINIPTLILWGAEDAVISPEFAYRFHKSIRKAELKIYENAGHWVQEELPEASAEDVRAFLEGRF